jgi:hypothetical protein
MVRQVLSFFILTALISMAEPVDPPLAPDATQPLPSLTCPAGAPLSTMELTVKSAANKEALPLQEINQLSEGDTVIYTPILRNQEKRPGEVALVLVPAKPASNTDGLIVTDPARADRPHEWPIPRTISLAAFVYGPQGLNKKKVSGFLSQDDQLVAQLADYAEKTSQTEGLLQALTDNAASSATMNAALNGFASQYGLAVQIDKNAPPAVQAQVLFATMNPQLATYNPIASDSNAQRLGQTASVATAAATLFFGSPIGIAAGGTAMLLDLRSIAFPGTQFRSSFAQPAKNGLHLCGQRGSLPPHTRVAYVWALRVPDTGSPAVKIGQANNLPLREKIALPVEANALDWKYLQRARNWELEDSAGKRTPIKALKASNDHSLDLELEQVSLKPGDYRLMADWDWTPFYANGSIHLRPLSDFKTTELDPHSQNALLAHVGKVPVTLRGSDFEFTDKVELQKSGDEFATAEPVRFLLPKGPRLGPQDSMDVQIDTDSLKPGQYALLITQVDGVKHTVNLRVLPPEPRIDNLPILVNEGVTAQHYVLKGERLDLLASLTLPNATIELGSPSSGGTERDITVHLENAAPGKALPIRASLTDRTAELILPDALQMTGPLPTIASSQLSLPPDIDIKLHQNEFPAGYTITAVLDVRNVSPRSELHLACVEDIGAKPTLHIGAQDTSSSLQQLSPDQLFLSYDTGVFPAGCTLQASIDNGRAGRSQPFTLAHLIRIPRILSLTPTNASSAVGLHSFDVTGYNLEMIGQLSWDQNIGIDVTTLPAAIPGLGQRQTLTVNLPDIPVAGAQLYVWLRGETSSRLTTVSLPPAQNPPVRADSSSATLH